MQIFEQHVFRFVFPFQGAEATFNIVANSQQDAAHILQEWMGNTMTELAISFPRTKPEENKSDTTKPASFEELAIQGLVDELSKHLSKRTSIEETVKEWIKIEYTPTNYPVITDELSKLKTMYETGKIKKGK